MIDTSDGLPAENVYGVVRGRSAPSPPVVIERVAPPDTTYSVSPDTTLRLQAPERSFTVEYAGLHFADPAATRFRVTLQGFDRRPTRPTRRSVRYTEVDPGTYTLVVRAAGEQDRWGEPVTQVAYAVGYESLSAFSTAFEEAVGTLPSTYTTDGA